MLHYAPSLLCLQEVDRIDDHAPFLRHAGYHWVYEKGYKGKQHGLLVAWKESEFLKERADWVKLDDLGTGGLSRKTRNIGLCVALRRKHDQSGIILATQYVSLSFFVWIRLMSVRSKPPLLAPVLHLRALSPTRALDTPPLCIPSISTSGCKVECSARRRL